MPLSPLLFYKINEMFPISFTGANQKSNKLNGGVYAGFLIQYLHFDSHTFFILIVWFFSFYIVWVKMRCY